MFLLVAAFLLWTSSASAADSGPDRAAVARIHGGIVDCVGCQLQGSDLSNTCVKGHDLHGANFDRARLFMMCMSFADFSNATFRNTDLGGANLAHAKLDGADLTGANLTITSIKGTDLRAVKGLTQAQVNQACGDAETRLPAGMTVHICT